ncbi:permease [Anaerobacillus alkaliphilus]|uniref:Permease n=1 Tax=Anaerobacillus alkaliphilus TaxID=1548597 RepID=A0A4Q0VZJ9_9BACI|nr:permease [Anaerobacillus alkaliphilus]RXJ04021.1 permease [Anaerobacillus alkaliphilus]
MLRQIQVNLVEITAFLIFILVIYFMKVSEGISAGIVFIPASLLMFNTIFISILIEAIPFVLIGVFIAGIIQVFVSEEQLKKFIPKNRFLAVIVSCIVGALFPACECGIVPIVRRLVAKGMPIFAGVGFLLTGPLINPIVTFSTYMAFGEDLRMAILRMVLGFIIALVIAFVISLLFKGNQLKKGQELSKEMYVSKPSLAERFKHMFQHAIDEFFSMGKYLVLGALLAAFVQTFISTKAMLGLGDGIVAATFVMMGLAYLLSLCSEADAFIAASFKHLFPQTSLLAFLIYGPMLDLKNTIMMMSIFKFRFVIVLMTIITFVVFGSLMIFHRFI